MVLVIIDIIWSVDGKGKAETDRQTETERETDSTDRQAGRQAGRQTDGQNSFSIPSQSCRQ